MSAQSRNRNSEHHSCNLPSSDAPGVTRMSVHPFTNKGTVRSKIIALEAKRNPILDAAIFWCAAEVLDLGSQREHFCRVEKILFVPIRSARFLWKIRDEFRSHVRIYPRGSLTLWFQWYFSTSWAMSCSCKMSFVTVDCNVWVCVWLLSMLWPFQVSGGKRGCPGWLQFHCALFYDS